MPKRLLHFVLFLLITQSSVAQDLKLLKTTYLPNYSSASSIDYFNGRLYVIGDDAPNMMILDTQHNVLDSLQLSNTKQRRISKAEKADLESSFITSRTGKTFLYAVSSFSTPKRNKVLILELKKNNKAVLYKTITTFLNKYGLAEINVEGAAIIGSKVILSNRANTTNKLNYLLVTGITEKGIQNKSFKKIAVRLPPGKTVTGISGLHYVKEKDILLFTASTEDTPNAYTDGAIGESYIGYIAGISSKLNSNTVSPDQFIALSGFLQQRTPQKIESITAEEGGKDQLIIHLAADNDDGSSTLYKMKWKL